MDGGVMTGRRNAAKAKTRAAVLVLARKLFAEVGYEAASIRDIAAAAGRTPGSIYLSWESKADLYREIHGHDPVTAEQGARMRAVLKAFVAHYPPGVNPFLDQAYGDALDLVGG